ncbi:sporulation histidine kinase inhibitor Sda [Shouchella patagoniensis]|nr:sporulation histidine kinase inhibitor Sda [Shouchella patagoniensis]
MSLKDLPNEVLIRSYKKAVKMKLDNEFIKLLVEEIERRKLKIEH